MAQLLGLSAEQVARIRPLLPEKRGGDDRKVLSGIIHVIQKGLRLGGCPGTAGPHKILYNRCRRW